MKYSKHDYGDQVVEFLKPVSVYGDGCIYVKLIDRPFLPTYAKITIKTVSLDLHTITYDLAENNNIPWEYIVREAPRHIVMDYINNQTNAPPNT